MWLPWVLAWLTFLPVVVLRAGELSEGDTFWETRTGLWIIAHHAIPAVDIFSWTVRGKPWTLNSWGFDLALGVAYRLGGLTGVAWECLLFAMVVAGLIVLLARSLGAHPLAVGSVLFLISPLLVTWLSARPQLADYAALPVLVLLLRRIATDGGRPSYLALAGALSLVWANLHSGAVLLGVAVAGWSGVLLCARDGWAALPLRGSGGEQLGRAVVLRALSSARCWWCVAVALAMLAAALINPYGFGAFQHAAQVRSQSAGIIVEWQPLNVAAPVQDLTVALGLIALVIAWQYRDLVLVSALMISIAGTAIAIRSLPFIVVCAVPLLAVRLSAPPRWLARYLRSRRKMLTRCGAVGLLALCGAATPSLTHIGQPNTNMYSVAVIRAIPAGCRLFNSDLLGGLVILDRPDVPVSLDTRNDLYGRHTVLAEERVLHGHGNWSAALDGVGCVLVPPRYGLAQRLRHDPGWRLRASSPAAVLFVRRSLRP